MKRFNPRLLAYPVLSIAFAVAALVVEPGESPEVIWPCLVVFYALLLRAARTPHTIQDGRSSYIKGDLLFLIFAYILFYLPYQLSVFGDFALWYSRFVALTFVEQTNESLLATTSGMLAFCAGVEYWRQRRPRRRATVRRPVSRAYVDGFILLCAAALLLLIAAYVATGAMASMMDAAYAGSTTNDRTQDGIYFLLSFFAMIISAAVVYRRWRFSRFGMIGWLALACVGAWAFALLVLGDRNSFLLIVLSMASATAGLLLRVRRLVLALGLMVALVGYNIVEAARQSDVRSLSSLLVAASGYSTSSYSDSSFTNTTVTARAAFALVPAEFPYSYGRFKLNGFAGIVPFSRGLFVKADEQFVTSSDLISTGVLGPHPTWSLGTNVISDIYVDFGLLSIPILMALAGAILGSIMRRASEDGASFESLMSYFVATPLFAELPRYSYDFPVRPLVWTVLVLAVFRKAWIEFSVHKSYYGAGEHS